MIDVEQLERLQREYAALTEHLTKSREELHRLAVEIRYLKEHLAAQTFIVKALILVRKYLWSFRS